MCEEMAFHGNDQQPRTILIRRHSAVTRVTHWVNVLCLGFLLLSGLQVFNAQPELYWGQYGADGDPALLTIGSADDNDGPRGFVRLGGITLPRAFPAWLTIPSFQDLAAGRRWHFFFSWFFLINGAVYLGYGILSGHFRRDLAPSASNCRPGTSGTR